MKQDIIEEIRECTTAGELRTLLEVLPTEMKDDPDVRAAAMACTFEPQTAQEPELKAPAVQEVTMAVIQRGGRKYKLLKTDVAWTTKPQVHAIMAILHAHMAVGDTVDEADIVKMMVANEAVLRTRQGGKRIWDYYKGDHNQGLAAHGNVERI